MGRRDQNNRGQQNTNRIPERVEEFAEINFKRYRKENKDYFDSKKELRRDYFATLAFNLSDVITWVLKSGHIQNPKIQETKQACYEKLAGEDGPKFIAYLTKNLDEYGLDSMENIEYLPIILHEIIADIVHFNESHPEDEQLAQPTELFALSEVILKKRLKKAKKKELDKDMMFDLLGVMPDPSAIKFGPFFRVRSIFELIYFYAQSNPNVPFGKIIEFLFDFADYRIIIEYALQERKEKYKNFTETQKKVFNDITEWVVTTMEEMDKEEIDKILHNYLNARKRDASQNKDSNRRYYLSSLPENLYPHIAKCVSRIKAADADAEKFL